MLNSVFQYIYQGHQINLTFLFLKPFVDSEDNTEL